MHAVLRGMKQIASRQTHNPYALSECPVGHLNTATNKSQASNPKSQQHTADLSQLIEAILSAPRSACWALLDAEP